MTFAVETVVNSTVMEERHSPVGCPDFKSGGRRQRVSGEFDSHLFRQFCSGRSLVRARASMCAMQSASPRVAVLATCAHSIYSNAPSLCMSVALMCRHGGSAITRACYWGGRPKQWHVIMMNAPRVANAQGHAHPVETLQKLDCERSVAA